MSLDRLAAATRDVANHALRAALHNASVRAPEPPVTAEVRIINMAAAPDTLDLPVIDLDCWLRRNESPAMTAAAAVEAKKVAETLHSYGIMIVKDPRVSEKDNDTYVGVDVRLARAEGI
jgi:hypothetical protein